MNDRPSHDVTLLLTRVNAGDPSAPGKLLELVYEDLRHLAAAYMRDERDKHGKADKHGALRDHLPSQSLGW